LEARQVSALVRQGRARNRHHGHLSSDSSFGYFIRFTDPWIETGPDRPQSGGCLGCRSIQYIAHRATRILHLLLQPVFTRAMKKTGHVGLDEPFAGLFTQGWWCTKPTAGQTANGPRRRKSPVAGPTAIRRRAKLISTGEPIEIGAAQKMSKSKRNTVAPTTSFSEYGADVAPLVHAVGFLRREPDVEWTERGVRRAAGFVQRLWRLVVRQQRSPNRLPPRARAVLSPRARAPQGDPSGACQGH